MTSRLPDVDPNTQHTKSLFRERLWRGPDPHLTQLVPTTRRSREVERLFGLRRALAIYRMVFGQSRQEDLITYLLAQIPDDEREVIVAELQIDLSPAN